MNLRVVHVAGTNGKGSVCMMLANALNCAGFKVGIYNSPHLLRWSDSVNLLGGKDVDAERNVENWHASVVDVARVCEDLSLTAFEVATAAMWLHFNR